MLNLGPKTLFTTHLNTQKPIQVPPNTTLQAAPVANKLTRSKPAQAKRLGPSAPNASAAAANAAGLTEPVVPAEAILRSLMVEHAVIIHGAVRQPGSYPVDGQVRLEMLLTTAGGLTAQADADAIEITGAADSSGGGAADSRAAGGTATSARRMVSLQAANGMIPKPLSFDL